MKKYSLVIVMALTCAMSNAMEEHHRNQDETSLELFGYTLGEFQNYYEERAANPYSTTQQNQNQSLDPFFDPNNYNMENYYKDVSVKDTQLNLTYYESKQQSTKSNKRKRRFIELADDTSESDDESGSLTAIQPYTYYSDEAAAQQQTGDLVVYGESTNNPYDNSQLSYSFRQESDENNVIVDEADNQTFNGLSDRLISLLPRSEIQKIIAKFISFKQEIPKPELYDSDSIDSNSIYVVIPPVICDEPLEVTISEPDNITGSIEIIGVLRRIITKKFVTFEPCAAGMIRRQRTRKRTITYKRTLQLIPNSGNYENIRIEEITDVDDGNQGANNVDNLDNID